MVIYTIKRILLGILVAFIVSMITFGLLFLSGDPAISIIGATATEEEIEYVRGLYGFERPLYVQYLDWVGKAAHGDFGLSYYYKLPVSEILLDKVPTTLKLGVCSIIFAIMLSVPLGVFAATRPNGWIDRLALTVSVTGMALPSFLFALLLMMLLSIKFPLLPPSGTESWLNFIMPTIVLGYFATPAIMRLTRSCMMDVLSADYIRTARAKGLREGKVIFKHALRNAVIPVVSVAAVQSRSTWSVARGFWRGASNSRRNDTVLTGACVPF